MPSTSKSNQRGVIGLNWSDMGGRCTKSSLVAAPVSRQSLQIFEIPSQNCTGVGAMGRGTSSQQAGEAVIDYHTSAKMGSGCNGSENVDCSIPLQRRRLSLSQSPEASTSANDERGQTLFGGQNVKVFMCSEEENHKEPLKSIVGLNSSVESIAGASTAGTSRSASLSSSITSMSSSGHSPSSLQSNEKSSLLKDFVTTTAASEDSPSAKISLLMAPLEVHKAQSINKAAVAPPNYATQKRLSVTGVVSGLLQENFEDKKVEKEGNSDASVMSQLGIGFACKKGLKPESPNQDDFFIVRVDDWAMYGVFDGHGPYGHDVSNYTQKEMLRLVYNSPFFESNPKRALREAFLQTHENLSAGSSIGGIDCSVSGTTATVVLHRVTDKKLYVAHVGDSRAVVGRVSKNGKASALDLTHDHKPNNEFEKQRIIARGGQVRRLTGDIPYRVFVRGRLYPGLAMSRAIGDTVGTQAGVIADPEVAEYNLDDDRDLFVILCSDGVWEFISSQEAVDIVSYHPFTKVQQAAEQLAKESWHRWIQEEQNVVDDITAQVIYLCPERFAKN